MLTAHKIGHVEIYVIRSSRVDHLRWVATASDMAACFLLPSLRSQPKRLNLSNKNLQTLPTLIGQLVCVNHMQLQFNNLTDLPKEFGDLVQVCSPTKQKCNKQVAPSPRPSPSKAKPKAKGKAKPKG